MRARRRHRLAAGALCVLVGAAVFLVAADLFPYHSVNDDEGVYLTQAAMLLDGRLFLDPGALGELVRPWFFVLDRTPAGIRMYSKYAPVAPAVFAVGMAVGVPRLSLAAVAAGNAALVYALTGAAFDRRTGLLAVVSLGASPLFLLTSSVFLAYAPTTLFELLFAVLYVRAARTGRRREAALAGAAIGVAFFSRPFTALLFAAPFVLHALLSLRAALGVESLREAFVAGSLREAFVAGSLREAFVADSLRTAFGSEQFRETAARYLAVALPGLGFVALTLSYNAVVTGDPLVFPYEAFAPRDGLGFGPRRILDYGRVYTPTLAARTALETVTALATDWTAGGLLGAGLAAVGLGRWLWTVDLADVRPESGERRSTRERQSPDEELSSDEDQSGNERQSRSEGQSPDEGQSSGEGQAGVGMGRDELRGVVALLIPAVVGGEAYFWGTANALDGGLVSLLGPYYHFDLLVPLAAFGAAGGVALARWTAATLRGRLDPRRARVVLALVLVVAAPVAVAAEAQVLADPVADNRQRTASLRAAYAPFERTDLDRAVVFVPDTYGDWLNHPFQWLRNGPGFDGPVVYVVDGDAGANFRALDATGDRRPYRYTYRGRWLGATRPVEPRLRPLTVLDGERVRAETTLGVPQTARSATVRVETERGYARYRVPADLAGTLTVRWDVATDGVRVTNLPRAAGPERVALPPNDSDVHLVVTFVGTGGSSVTYRQTVAVSPDSGGGVRAIWPPETRVCRLTTQCGHEGTWVGPDGEYVEGVSVSSNATAT